MNYAPSALVLPAPLLSAPFLSALALVVAGCATTQPAANGLVHARLGQQVDVDGPRVTPLAVIEDSRCPQRVTCVWAGRLRLSVRIDLGKRSETREIELGKPQHVANGSLELVQAAPVPSADKPTDPKAYRFAFRFRGGL